NRLTRLVVDALAANVRNIVRFEQQRSELIDLGLQVLDCKVQRRTADRGPPAAESPNPVLHDRSIAVQHDHIIDSYAELVCRDLSEGGLLALTMGRDPRHCSDLSGRLDLYGRALPATGGRSGRGPDRTNLTIGADADSHQAPLPARVGLLGTQLVV